MRKTDYSSSFKRDFKRERKGKYRSLLDRGGEYEKVVALLLMDIPLPPKYRDHPLHHNMEGRRECHIRA